MVAHIAHSVEHFLGKEEVVGSIPVVGSISFGDFFCQIFNEFIRLLALNDH